LREGWGHTRGPTCVALPPRRGARGPRWPPGAAWGRLGPTGARLCRLSWWPAGARLGRGQGGAPSRIVFTTFEPFAEAPASRLPRWERVRQQSCVKSRVGHGHHCTVTTALETALETAWVTAWVAAWVTQVKGAGAASKFARQRRRALVSGGLLLSTRAFRGSSHRSKASARVRVV
jgi:hypothetical protein